MSTPAAQIVATGTPNTSQLGVGAVAGNTVTIGGVTLAPNQPGWTLVSSQGGPGSVSGTWQYGVAQAAQDLPVQGAFYRSGSGAGGGGGGGEDEGLFDFASGDSANSQLTGMGWALVAFIATLLLTKKR